jgi:hypothetical protein
MKKIHITFSGAAYDFTTSKIAAKSKAYGSDDLWVYDDRWLTTTPLYRDNQWLWTCKGVGNPDGGRGFGWFSWKPYVLMDALSRVNDGDIVMFTDADTYPISNFSMLYRECERIGGMMFFAAQGCENRHWCKRDCFIRMGLDEPKYWDSLHAVARFYLFQKGAKGTTEFLMEWLKYCLDRQATTFDPSELGPELEGFREHRTEQAILTNLCTKYGHKLYREACQNAKDQPDDQDLYPQLFIQDGTVGAKSLAGSQYFYIPGVAR